MATDEKKTQNRFRLYQMMLMGMALGVWNLIGETAKAISPKIGEQILAVMEKEEGLEIAGETPENVLTEIGRLYVDELGSASAAELETDGNVLSLKLRNAAGMDPFVQLKAAGVEPFFDPVMCVGLAALARMGKRARVSVEIWEEGKGRIIHYELVSR